ncbi:MAG TPA: HEAT repeat domain-containing protein [Myxococcales bacterium]|nr:HEAT repeat domain-containing protein [Myxococcales bacterium]
MSDPSPQPGAQESQRDAEALLRAALERLVLLECHQAVAGPAAPSTSEAARLDHELRRLRERAEAAEAQRDRLFAHVIDAERVRESLGGAEAEDPLDLASFIAELRSELAEVQRARDLADRRNAELSAELREARAPLGIRRALDWARGLEAQGLLFRGEAKLGEMWPELCVGTPTERLVLAAVVRDLDSGDASLREAALGRLGALPPTLAAPIVAAALGRERDPGLLEKLLRLGGRLGVRSLLPLVEGELANADEHVRAAALVATVRLGAGGDDLARWSDDPSPRVRRSAALASALCRPDAALPVLEKLAADTEPAVRKLAAASCAALPALPEPLLRRFGNDEDAGVRKTALKTLRAAPELEKLPAAQRRQRLKAEPPPAVRAVKVPAPAAAPDPGFDPLPAVERELRSSLRGRTDEELAQALSLPLASLTPALARGISEGRLVRRGQKIYAS